MALTESTVYDKIEIVGDYKAVQVRQKTVIKKDDVEVASSFHRYTLYCGALKGGFKEDGTTPADDADDFVDTDLSGQPTEIQNICNAVWTTDVKTAYKALLISQKPLKIMEKNEKRIEQLKLEMQVAVDEFNKIQDKIQELMVARDALKMKAYSCSERLKELEGIEEITTEIRTEVVK